MTRTRTASSIAFTAVVVAVVAVAAVAFACVPSSHLWAEPDFGMPGAVARMHGTGFAGPEVEIRWSNAENAPGALLAKATAPNFVVDFTIPATAVDGIYTVFAMAPSADPGSTLPSSRIWNRTSFEVSAANVRGTWINNSYGGRPAEPVTASQPATPATAAPAPSTQPAVQPAPVAAATPQPAPVVAATPQPAATASRPTATRPVVRVAPAAPAAPVAPAAAAPAPVAAIAPDATPEPATAPPPASSSTAAEPSAPAASQRVASSAAHDGNASGMGVALFSIGLVVLFGGFAAAALTRRRAEARSRSGRRG